MHRRAGVNHLIRSIGLIIVVGASACVGGAGAGREGVAGREASRFDPGAVELVDGTILGADRTAPADALARSVAIRVGRPEGELRVELAPGWYLDRHGLRLDPEERIQVRGSRVQGGGPPTLLAQEVTTHGKSVRLRDEVGRPLWEAEPEAEGGPAPEGDPAPDAAP
ncbi:MAG: hypothetical protein OZ921_17755 [Sorangiineae bacterium]|nr:hypothetical protein [Polyangiaceae bacterium]MEB2324364.1 hypothetical protein [Sorangiineae bacterium]